MPETDGLCMQGKIFLILVLTVMTIAYSIVLDQSLQAYERSVARQVEQACADSWPGAPGPIFIDPYITTSEGVLAIILGAGLAVSWMVLVRVGFLNVKLQRQKFETD